MTVSSPCRGPIVERVAHDDPTARRVPRRRHDVRSRLVGARRRDVDTERTQPEIPRLAVEQRPEHAGRVEARHAQPRDATVGRDQRTRVAVGEERVVLDRRKRRWHRRTLLAVCRGNAHDLISLLSWGSGRSGLGRPETCGSDVGDDDRDDHERRQGDCVGLQEDGDDQHRRKRKAQHGHGHRPDAHGNPGDHRQTRKVGEGDAADRADEHAGEGRAASERAERDAIGEALADDEQHERAHRPILRLLDEPRQRGLPGKEDLRGALVGPLTEGDREAGDRHSGHRRQQYHPALDDGLEQQAQPSNAVSEHSGGEPDPDRPEELACVRRRERRNVGDRKREGPEAGPRVQPDEDERAHARGEQARHEHDSEHRAPEPGHLHEQEGSR